MLSFAVLAAVPVGLLLYAAVALSSDAVTREAEQGAADIARTSSSFIEERFTLLTDSVDHEGKVRIAPVLDSDARLQANLDDLVGSHAGIDAAFVVGREGFLRVASPANANILYAGSFRDDWLAGVTSTGRPFVTSIVPSRVDVGAVAVATPLQQTPGSGGVDAYLVAMSHVTDVQAFVDSYRSSSRASLVVLDRHAFPVAAPGLRPGANPASLGSDPQIEAAIQGHASVVKHDRIGETVFTACAPIKGIGWVAMVDVPASGALAEVTNLRTTVIAVGLTLGVILAVGLAGGLSLVRRAEQTAALSLRIGSLDRLNRAARRVHSERGMAALDSIAKTGRELVGASISWITLSGPRQAGQPRAFAESSQEPLAAEPFRALAGVLDRSFSPESVVRLAESTDLAFADHGDAELPTFGPLLALPLLAGSEVLGRLAVARLPGSRSFAEEDEALLKQLAEHAVTAVVKMRQDQEREVFLEELNNKNKELARSSQLKSRFLANMSHELRTPLNSILGFGQLLAANHVGPLNNKQRSYIENIASSGHHLLTLINEILDLSKIEADRMTLELGEHQLAPMVSDVLVAMRPEAESRGLELKAEMPVDHPAVICDGTRIRQVVTNLVSNAIKFTPRGSVTVRCQTLETDMELSVIDTGIGIEPEAIDMIFEEFTQAENSTTRRFGGTGLGLTICRKLIEIQHGTIGVESTPGEGSRFWFTLPISTPVGERER